LKFTTDTAMVISLLGTGLLGGAIGERLLR
jgi:hypothetical protein